MKWFASILIWWLGIAAIIGLIRSFSHAAWTWYVESVLSVILGCIIYGVAQSWKS
jgi:predicted membrane channel-forming protein YqfA (hemolysin III family)